MKRTRYKPLIGTAPISQLPIILSGESEDFSQPWLKTHWKQVRGMNMATGVKFDKRKEYRIYTGSLEGFIIPEKLISNVNILFIIN